MDKLLLRTFAFISVAFVTFVIISALLPNPQLAAQDEVVVVAPTVVPPTAVVIQADPARGQEIFEHGVGTAPACAVCHLVEKEFGRYSVGPLLGGVATRAGERIAGLSAEQYLYNSITDPGSYVVDGFTNAMFPKFADVLSDEQIDDLIAYLMTLE